jgi:hypothetical protein
MTEKKREEDYDANRRKIEDLCNTHPNNLCSDCSASGTRWVSINHGVFICIRCSGIHRGLGVHVSKVKSTNMDKWTRAEIRVMEQIGNKRAKELYEARLPRGAKLPNDTDSDGTLKEYISKKYELKSFAIENLDALLGQVYDAAHYKDGKKMLKNKVNTSERVSSGAAAEAGGKKSKKSKNSGPFGTITVLDNYDSVRATLLSSFGLSE